MNNEEKTGTVDDLTLRKLHEMTATPLKTTVERVAYLKGRSDKAREIIQDLYCNHDSNLHSIYSFFKDHEISYEEIIEWEQEAADYMERRLTSRIARRAAVQMLQDGQEPDKVCVSIEKWFSVSFTDAQMIALRRQANLNKCMSETTVKLDEED